MKVHNLYLCSVFKLKLYNIVICCSMIEDNCRCCCTVLSFKKVPHKKLIIISDFINTFCASVSKCYLCISCKTRGIRYFWCDISNIITICFSCIVLICILCINSIGITVYAFHCRRRIIKDTAVHRWSLRSCSCSCILECCCRINNCKTSGKCGC